MTSANRLTVPEIMLRDIHNEIPDLNSQIAKLISAKGKQLPDWADWCLLPSSGWIAIAQNVYEDHKRYMNLGHRAEALGKWQFSKGIYAFDTDFLAELLSSPLESDMPSDILLRLPEFCVYIDLSNGLPRFPDIAEYLIYGGFFASLEDDRKNDRRELRIYVPGHDIVPLHLGNWSVDIAIDRFLAEAQKFAQLEMAVQMKRLQDETVEYLYSIYSRLINLILYLCSSEPDITTDRQPGYSRYRAEPVKTKKGLRLFPADRIHNHNVGASIGAQLRQTTDTGAKVAPIEYQGGTKRAHLRRGHWHGYWKGSRKAEDREFIFHWIPPLIAGGKR